MIDKRYIFRYNHTIMKNQTRKLKKLFSFLVPLLIIALLVGVAVFKRNRDRMITLKTKTIPEIVQKLAGNATMKDVTNLKKESGLYSFDLNFEVNGEVQKYTSYMTRDGKIFFISGIKVADINKPAAEEKPKMFCTDVNKAEKPKLTAFVVANCPFGLQMQRVIKKAIDEEKNLLDVIDVKYIGAITDGKITSMHGDEEAQENLRQICIREEQMELYWPYVSCYMKKQGESTNCLASSRVNTSSVNACMKDAKSGLAFAQKDFDLANAYKIGSSPTLLVNDKQIVSE